MKIFDSASPISAFEIGVLKLLKFLTVLSKRDGFLQKNSSFTKWLLTSRTQLLHNKMSQMVQEVVFVTMTTTYW